MSKLFRAEGKSVKIWGQTATIPAGRIFRRGNPLTELAFPTGNSGSGNGWGGSLVGVVTDEIIGTTETLTTVDGRPILIGDGVSAEAQTGDGKGDMGIEGVYTLLVDGTSAVISGGMPAYMQVADFANPQGTLIASGVTRNDDFPVSGALVGFAVEDEYTGDTAPFAGRRVADIKLLGNALHGIAHTAP